MSWKNIKEHYAIVHQVQVTSEGICIGSPYIHDIIVLNPDGTLKKRYESSGSNEDLIRYQQELEADPVRVRALIEAPDVFSKSVPVYTYHGGDIIEKQCEKPGWPNVTHDGQMMYGNTFFTSKAKAVKAAKENAAATVELWEARVADLQHDLEARQRDLAEAKADVAKLNTDHP